MHLELQWDYKVSGYNELVFSTVKKLLAVLVQIMAKYKSIRTGQHE